MNLGRLRVATKGVDRAAAANGNGSGLSDVPADEQFARGMYMIGQVAALRDKVIDDRRAARGRVRGSTDPAGVASRTPQNPEPPAPPPCDVAIIGLSCFYPEPARCGVTGRTSSRRRTRSSRSRRSHWDWRPYYDPDPRAKDKIVSKWGGFLADIPFDPLKYGITPKSIPNIEPLQLLLLEAVQPGARRRRLRRTAVQPRADRGDPRRRRRRDAAGRRLRLPRLPAAARLDPRRAGQVERHRRARRGRCCRSGPRTRSPASC